MTMENLDKSKRVFDTNNKHVSSRKLAQLETVTVWRKCIA